MARVDGLVQVISGVVGQPHFALIILPDQRLRWQVDCYQWDLDQNWRSAFGIAKYDDGTRSHVETEFLGSVGVVYFSENYESRRLSLFYRSLKSHNRFFH